jgi:hypothetical protein
MAFGVGPTKNFGTKSEQGGGIQYESESVRRRRTEKVEDVELERDASEIILNNI